MVVPPSLIMNSLSYFVIGLFRGNQLTLVKTVLEINALKFYLMRDLDLDAVRFDRLHLPFYLES